MRQRNQRGSAIVEFVLVGIPMMFVWISVVQMALGMWHYHTIQYAVKTTGQYIAHHGSGYVSAGNTAKTIGAAATVLASSAIGIPESNVTVTWTSGATTVTGILSACKTDSTTWPPTVNSGPGQEFTVKADWIFRSAISMYA